MNNIFTPKLVKNIGIRNSPFKAQRNASTE